MTEFRQECEQAHGGADTDIAIVGLALRVPGATTPQRFWHNLRDGVESVREFSESELAERGVSARLLKNPHYVRRGAPLDDMELFDAEFFGFSPKEAAILDPQHRQFYECAWEALENAGHPPERFDGAVGVFGGCGMAGYFAYNLLSNPDLVDSVGLFLLRHTGNDKDFLCTRVSYALNLRGPSVNVQTACSTSLVAAHMACQSLLNGECDMALAGGSTIELPHRVGYLYQQGEILSPDGHCRAFDHRSEGTIFGSGTGVVVLRRLADALADGDYVHAVIKGSAVNNDGAGKVGYLAPSVEGQAAAVAEALAVADLSADSIGYVECHGTGTPVGDPIEVAALTEAFRQTTDSKHFCAIGSVKTNIGHLDTAAGVASLIKTALALEHGQLPPSLNFEAPNPTIDFAASPFYVNDRLSDWPTAGGPRRAGVNSLGVGGTNAFAILQQPPARVAGDADPRRYQLLTLSGRSREALDANAKRLADHLRDNPQQPLADVAYTLQVGRRHFDQRRVLAVADHQQAVSLLESSDPQRVFTQGCDGDQRSVVFMFPGGGAQYPNMGRDLYDHEKPFREQVDLGLQMLGEIAGRDLKPLLFPAPESADVAARRLQTPSLQLPAIFIVEYALAQTLIGYGITPAALIGHSMGENTAACLAGVLSYRDALGLVYLRGRLMDGVPSGGMLSVPLPADELWPLLGKELDLASANSPQLSVASGPDEALERLAQFLTERGIEGKRVPINIAAHSRLLDGILNEFGDYLRAIELRPPQIPFISNRSGTWITDQQATSPDYWVEHLRHTVNFGDGVATLLQQPERAFLEVGPGQVLGSLTRQQPGAPVQRVFSALRHGEEKTPDDAYLMTALGRLWASGVTLDATKLWPGRRNKVPLPSYAFQGKRYWIDPGKGAETAAKPYAQAEKLPHLDDWFYQPTWVQQGVLASTDARPETWLVFVDDCGVGDRLIEQLRERGRQIVTVRSGDAYYKISDHEYRLSPELGREGYSALLRDLLASGKVPNRILHLWLLNVEESFRPGSSFFHRNQEYGFYSLFFLAKAFGDEGVSSDDLHLIAVTNGMQRVVDEAVPYPEKATVLGPAKMIPREFPGASCICVDIELAAPSRSLFRIRPGDADRDPAQALDACVDMLGVELFTKPHTAVVAYRDGVRWQQRYQRVPTPADPQRRPPLRNRGVYLITGGLGGIGRSVAEHLARTVNARLVLVNRTPLPAREDWPAWLKQNPYNDPISRAVRSAMRLEQAGAEVFVASADVTDGEGMREIVSQAESRFGPINGVLHAAGVVRDNLIQVKTQTEVEEVFTAKVYGTLVLDQLFSDKPLDFMVLFSSTSTAVAPTGQIDYVAANAFLNAYASSRAGLDQGGRMTLAVNWGVWNEVGMAAAAAARMGYGEQTDVGGATVDSRHPLFDSRLTLIEDESKTHVLTGHYSPRSHWLLDEHRTAQGHALVPGTGYLELARAALRECGETGFFALENLFFFRPLHIADNRSREVRVKLRQVQSGYAFEVQSKHAAGTGNDNWERHAQADVALKTPGKTPAPLDIDATERRCRDDRETEQDGVALRSRQEDHLQFGPRWRVLRSIGYNYAGNEALARLALAPEYATDLADFALHPALLDLATGYAMNLIESYRDGATAANLWVPVSYGRVRVYRPLRDTVYSRVRSRDGNRVDAEFARFDIVIADNDGQVLLEIEDFMIKKLADSAEFALTAQPAASEVETEPVRAPAGELRQLSPAELVFQHNLSHGILPDEGSEALRRALAGATAPEIVISSLPLEQLIDEADTVAELSRTTQDGAKFSRPELDSDYEPPRDEIERTLVGFWEELLGVDQVGVNDNFFDLGGHSLIAVRLFAKIRKTYHNDYPISVLFEAPTVAACGELIRASLGADDPAAGDNGPAPTEQTHQSRYTHLVPMHPDTGGDKTPFFLVAGMFGNVLNLRHLAQLIGSERPFYGLQARGLYGDYEPHATYEDMARDYITEMRTVQPRGPYLLGGFSGGGITAYEIARQLRDAGDEIALLVMLDTPLPHSPPLSSVDRVSIHWQRLRRKGPSYFSEWARNRYRWELDKFRKRFEGDRDDAREYDFHSEKIELAFRRALDRYDLQRQPIGITLLRPRLDRAYTLSGGRVVNKHLDQLVSYDNGWGAYVDEVDVHEVPGDHDSMVLEPNVRVLAARLRLRIEEAENRSRVEPLKAAAR